MGGGGFEDNKGWLCGREEQVSFSSKNCKFKLGFQAVLPWDVGMGDELSFGVNIY